MRPPSGAGRRRAELLRNVKELPASVSKSQDLRCPARQAARRAPKAGRRRPAFGEKNSRRSIADIVDAATLAQVRAYKQDMKAAKKAEAAAAAAGKAPRPQRRRSAQRRRRHRRAPGGSAALGLSSDLAGRRLYLCTQHATTLPSSPAPACARVDIVQLRDKRLEARQLLESARVLRASARLRCPVHHERPPDLALEVGADGVHVGQDDAPATLARRILGPEAIIGSPPMGRRPRRARPSRSTTSRQARSKRPRPSRDGGTVRLRGQPVAASTGRSS